MRKHLISIIALILLGANAFVLYSFTNQAADCGDEGDWVNVTVKVKLPSNFVCSHSVCTETPNGFFAWSEIQNYDSWYMTTQLFRNQSQQYYHKYGNLPGGGGSGIKQYTGGTCTPLAQVVGGSSCSQFPIRLKTGATNELRLTVRTPCSCHTDNVRAQVYYKMNIASGDIYNGAIISLIAGSSNVTTTPSYSIVCDPCI